MLRLAQHDNFFLYLAEKTYYVKKFSNKNPQLPKILPGL